MHATLTRAARLVGRREVGYLALLLVAVLPPVILLPQWEVVRSWRPWGLIGLVDGHDIGVYFGSSAWVTGQGALYAAVPSEYPLLANLMFATVRLVADAWRPFADPSTSFEFTWVTLAWWVYLGTFLWLWRQAPRAAALLWLNPAALYFTLYRFDIAPVLATLAMLLAARDGRVRRAAFWLGLAIALKGYALYFLPAFAVWAWLREGRRRAAIAVAVALLPLAASLVVVLALSGLTAMLYPFRVQAIRGPNGQSTWDAVRLVTHLPAPGWVRHRPWIPLLLQVVAAAVAAGMRPRSFGGLVNAFIISVGGFVTFSVFYSPQFVLWFVPPALLSGSLLLQTMVAALGWITIAYFPILFFASRARQAYELAVVAVTAVRSGVVLAAFRRSRRGPDAGEAPAEVPRPPTVGGSMRTAGSSRSGNATVRTRSLG